jgi:hypothetical protein
MRHPLDEFPDSQPATPSFWETASARWLAQIMVGALPGLLLLATLLHAARTLDPQATQGSSAASMVPLLAAGHLGSTEAFQRRQAAHVEIPLVRAPSLLAAAPAAASSSARQRKALPVDFSQPRVQWQQLGKEQRSQLDAGLARPAHWERVVLHGSRAGVGGGLLLERYHTQVLGIDTGLAHHFVIGNGHGAADGAISVSDRWQAGLTPADMAEPELRVGSISICLVGDFHHSEPTAAQLAALDELLDYLRIKLGALPVTTHRELTGSSCLGPCFPEQELLEALQE